MKVFELENILQDALNELEGHNEDETLVVYPMTYGVNLPFIALRNGYVSLKTIETEEEKMSAKSLNERKGEIRHYRGCHIRDMGDVYVVTNENGLNIGEEKTEIGCEAIIDEYLDGKVDETLQKKSYVIKENDNEYDRMFKHIFPSAAINDEQAYDFMYNIGKIVKKWLDKDVNGDCFFLLQTILKKILRYSFGSDSDRSWDWILNKIDETIMRYFNDEDLGTRCVREIMDFIDGWM